MDILLGVMIPFFGTTLGSACVFFLKDKIKPGIQKILLGFASGVMVAASVWSLLIRPWIFQEKMGKWSFLPAAAGFLIGIAFLLLLDSGYPISLDCSEPEGPACATGKVRG